MEVSISGGTPKSSNLMGFSLTKTMYWGIPWDTPMTMENPRFTHSAPGEDAEDAVDLLRFLRKQKGLKRRERSPRSGADGTVNKHGEVLKHQKTSKKWAKI